MYCPSCGSEERQMSQYCRACGTDLQPVRQSLERSDSVTASAVTAREEIGRAIAEKIRDLEGSRDLKRVAEDVLPQIEKFLESPEEKRLRRMRSGVITAASGLGATLLGIVLFLAVIDDPHPEPHTMAAIICGLGAITFLIGLGLVLNGILFTKPAKELRDNSAEAKAQDVTDRGYSPEQLRAGGENPELFRTPTTSDLAQGNLRGGSSITEHTTHHLKKERY